MPLGGRFTTHWTANEGWLLPMSFKEFGWDFAPKRIFVVSDVPPHTKRGGHAHKENSQILICLNGSVNVITIDYIKMRNVYQSVILNRGQWLYHPPLQWADIEFIDEGATLLSLCSHDYDEDDYLHTEGEWKSYVESVCTDCYCGT